MGKFMTSIEEIKARAGGIIARLEECKGLLLAAQEIADTELPLAAEMVQTSGLDSAQGAVARIQAVTTGVDDAVANVGLAQEQLESFKGSI